MVSYPITDYPLIIPQRGRGNVPKRVQGEDGVLMKSHGLLLYNKLREYNLTFQELIDMQINIDHLLIGWVEAPSALNVSFEGLSTEGLKLLCNKLRTPVMKERFYEINWFKIGLTEKDMIRFKMEGGMDFEVFKIFNVTLQDLVEHKVHNRGSTWQSLFQWTPAQWKEIGYVDKKFYLNLIKNNMENTIDEIKNQKLFGPS